MNKTKFVTTVREMLRNNKVEPSSFKMNALNNFGRELENCKIDTAQAIDRVRSLFSEEYSLLDNRSAWKELERKLR